MNVCALISGGKDSFYSAYLTLKAGHKIVALANLAPFNKTDEMDSQCFQTVGHNIISAYAEATGIILFREFTKGKAKCNNLDYEIKNDDEVEDLYKLLQKVINDKNLNVNAICCGAIASTYQYNRVKNVAKRLNLHVLTPMWGLNDEELINCIIKSGIEALIAKVASAGLDESFIGKTITYEMINNFKKLKEKYGMNLCGEGGEYESLVLYCPLLFKKKIKIIDSKNKFLDTNPFAPSIIYIINNYKLENLD